MYLSVSGTTDTSRYTIWGAVNSALYFSANDHLYKYSKNTTTKILGDVRLSTCVITRDHIVFSVSKELSGSDVVKSASIRVSYVNDEEKVHSRKYTYVMNQRTSEITLLLIEEHGLRA